MNKDPFKEYIRESEPDKRDKGYAWHTAIGLQAVDGLKTSEYLTHTAVRNIEGEISFEEADALLWSYYEENPSRDAKTVLRRLTRSRLKLQLFFPRGRSVSRQMNTFPYTESCSLASIPMRDGSGIIT